MELMSSWLQDHGGSVLNAICLGHPYSFVLIPQHNGYRCDLIQLARGSLTCNCTAVCQLLYAVYPVWVGHK